MRDDEQWIAEQFGQAELGDARRSRRAEQVALAMLAVPGKGLPTQTKTWGGLKAAYRLMNSPDVTREKLMKPHFKQTLAVAGPGTLFVQDTTELDFTQKKQTEGFGPIGNHKGSGLFVHSLMAMTPEGQVLGLAGQRTWARSKGPAHKKTETRAQRQVRTGKESEVWAGILADVGPVPEGQRWISVGDRGSDSFDYWQSATAMGWECLSRIYINRRTDENGHLLDRARLLPAQGREVVQRRARPGKAAHTLHLALAWSAVQVLPPCNRPKSAQLAPLDVSVIRCWDDAHGVEWLLLSTGPVNSLEDAAQCVRCYEQRWSIEEFHKCLKSGCHIEDSQFKTAGAVDVLLGFCSITAVRLLALARMARIQPETPATSCIDADYLRVLCAVRKLSAETLTVRCYWREIAKMGGFLARTRDGDPGWQTLWKGLLKLEDMVDGFRLGQKCG